MRSVNDSEQALDSVSTRSLVNLAVEQTGLIVRQELALARAEFAGKAKRALLGVLLSAGAAVLAFAALLCGIAAAIAGLAGVLPTWAAALIVAGILLAAAGIGGLAALRAFAKAAPSTPPDVVASVKADVIEVKERLRR